MAAASTIRTARSDEMMRWIENAHTAFEATGRTIINHNHQMVREYNFQRAEIEKMTRHRVRLSEASVTDTELNEMRLRTIRGVNLQISYLEDQCSKLMERLSEFEQRHAIHTFDWNLEARGGPGE